MEIIALIVLGVLAGILSGMFGIGGGVVIVPALLLFWKMNILQASATSLGALLLPVGILAAAEYYRAGHLRPSIALWIALGLLVGALFGARIALSIDKELLKRIWGAFLVLVGLYYLVFERMVRQSATDR